MAASKMDLASFNVRNKVRALVSADRERFQDGRFDLDLSYITPNIIAMALPTSGLSTGIFPFKRNRNLDFFGFLFDFCLTHIFSTFFFKKLGEIQSTMFRRCWNTIMRILI